MIRLEAEYLPLKDYQSIIDIMQPLNGLALEISLETGLRIDDVLKIKWCDLNGAHLKFTAKKTGKSSDIKLSPQLIKKILNFCPIGEYLFPGRCKNSHRTRQAVYIDMRKAALLLHIPEHVSPHSARKTFAVNLRKKGASERDIQEALQHSDKVTTRIYSRSDRLKLTPERLDELIELITQIVTDNVLVKIGNSTQTDVQGLTNENSCDIVKKT